MSKCRDVLCPPSGGGFVCQRQEGHEGYHSEGGMLWGEGPTLPASYSAQDVTLRIIVDGKSIDLGPGVDGGYVEGGRQ